MIISHQSDYFGYRFCFARLSLSRPIRAQKGVSCRSTHDRSARRRCRLHRWCHEGILRSDLGARGTSASVVARSHALHSRYTVRRDVGGQKR